MREKAARSSDVFVDPSLGPGYRSYMRRSLGAEYPMSETSKICPSARPRWEGAPPLTMNASDDRLFADAKRSSTRRDALSCPIASCQCANFIGARYQKVVATRLAGRKYRARVGPASELRRAGAFRPHLTSVGRPAP